MGYMYNEEATQKTFDEEGWLHTVRQALFLFVLRAHEQVG